VESTLTPGLTLMTLPQPALKVEHGRVGTCSEPSGLMIAAGSEQIAFQSCAAVETWTKHWWDLCLNCRWR
jgi:hypothetical protein